MHGIPSPARRLEEGQLLSLDFEAIWEGFHADSAVTVVVGGVAPTEDAARLVKTTEEALYAGIAAVRPGGRISDIGHAIASVAEAAGLGIVREYGGHGIGRSLHEDLFIQNFGRAGQGPDLRPGLVIAIEPMLMLGEEPDQGARRRVDGRHGRRLAVGALRAHRGGHRGRARGAHGARMSPFVDVRAGRPLY